MELTVLMPSRNDAETLSRRVREAFAFLSLRQIDGEVVVADAGSVDGSPEFARAAGARVVGVPEGGYGDALMGGITAARGDYVITADADGSYDFAALLPCLERLRAGADLVVGNRFRGSGAPGMTGAPRRGPGEAALSVAGRLLFRSRVGDLQCGLRGFRRETVLGLGLRSPGREFASEMVARAALAGQRIEEIPVSPAWDRRGHPSPPGDRRDGWRHFRFLLMLAAARPAGRLTTNNRAGQATRRR